jgi:cobalt-zinc-cadmium efflux system outer membrane protein
MKSPGHRPWTAPIATSLLAGLLASCSTRPDIDVSNLDRLEAIAGPPAPESHPPPAGTERLHEQLLKKEELTLEDVLWIADALNPDLNEARKNVDLGNAMVWDASLYPNPQLLAQLDDYHPKTGSFATSKRTIGLGFPIVVGGRIQANIHLAEAQRDQMTLQYVWTRRDILTQVKQAFLGVLSNQQSLALAQETLKLIKSFHTLAQERFNLRAIPEMELLKATVELAKAENDVRLGEKKLSVATKTLKALLGNADLPKEKFRGTLPDRYTIPPVDVLRPKVIEKHPLLEAVKKEREIHEREVDLLKSSTIPDIQVQVLAGADSTNETVILGGLSVNLPVFDRNQAKITMARIALQQAEFRFQSQLNDLLLKLSQFHQEVQTSQAQVLSYELTILPSAQKALEQTTEGYKQGKFTYLDVLDAQRTLVEARAGYSDSLLDLSNSASELEKLLGSRLEVGK